MPSAVRLPRFAILLSLLWLALVEVGVAAWYRAQERNLIATPTWSVRWPESVPGFRELKIDENVRSTLRYDRGRQGVWPTTLADPTPNERLSKAPATSSMFFFRWEPGTTNILRARAHRPDVCLPNVGWRVAEDHGVRNYPTTGGGSLPFRHFRFVRGEGDGTATAHAFFCQREDRVPRQASERIDATGGELGGWGRSDRLRVVLEGVRNQGQQVLEVVLTTAQPASAAEAEEWFAELVPEIVTTDASSGR